MKLSTICEAKLAGQPRPAPHFQRLFGQLKSLKPDLTLDDVAKFAATIQAEYLLGMIQSGREYVAYVGLTGTRDNPQEIDSILESFHDPDDPDGASWQEILDEAKDFLKIK